MLRNNGNPFLQAVALGAVAGMRTASAPAVVVTLLARRRDAADATLLRYVSSAGAAKTARLMALGEMVVDKLPAVPARTEMPGLIARLLSGGLTGAAIGVMHRRNGLLTGAIGALAAAGATFGAYQIRKQAAEETAVPDPLLGLAEDLIVATIGYYLLHRVKI